MVCILRALHASFRESQSTQNVTMVRVTLTAIFWLLLFAGLATLPIIPFKLGNVPAPRNFWIEFGVYIGFGLLMILSLQFFLTAKFAGIGKPFGTDTILQFHRHAGILVSLFLFGHIAVLFWTEPQYWEFLDPRVNALRAIFLTLATLMLILLIVLSVWRKRIKLKYEWWRLTHGLMSLAVLGIGLAHAWQVEHYVSGWAKRGWLVLIVGIAGGSYLYARFGRAWWARRKPYRVSEVRKLLPDVVAVTFSPQGHRGFNFRGGQYAWISLDKNPLALQQNPYSLSSSSHQAPGHVEFTAKHEGEFSERMLNLEQGAVGYLEGPYGEFCLDQDTRGAVFIVGGIGVTPSMSILRSLRDQGDKRPLFMFYGNTSQQEIVFREELEEVKGQLNLKVIHVLSEAEEGWDGETGYIEREVLEKYLTDRELRYDFFVCGPVPMMDSVERDLLAMGVPLTNLRAERFDIV
jgi:predicted ferric reductase